MKKFYFSLLAICVLPVVATARQNIVNTNISIIEEYDSNRYETEDNRVDYWMTTVMPSLSLLSSGIHDTVELTYIPEFIFDHDRDTNDITHDVTFNLDRQLNSLWQMNLIDNFSYLDFDKIDMGPAGDIVAMFVRADTYVQEEVVRILFPELGEYDPATDYNYVLSELEERYIHASPEKQTRVVNLLRPDDPGRRRHYTNEATLDFIYEFGQDSFLTFGYTMETLNDKSAYMAEYTIHNPHFSLAYVFDQQWSLDFSYDYSWWNYDDVEDESDHEMEFRLNYNLNPHDLLYCSYNFAYTDYDDNAADDFNSQDGGLGWEHDFGSHAHLVAYLGGSYEHRDIHGDERGYEANATYTADLQQGNYYFGLEGGFDEYCGSRGWNDLREYYTLNTGMNYELLEDLSFDAAFTYERNISWARIVDHNRTIDNDYDAGVGFIYTFQHWYSVSLRYNYHVLNTDGAFRDDYYDHQVFLELTVAKDIFHW